MPPETLSLLDRGTAETCAVLPPANISGLVPFVRLMYPKLCGTPFVRTTFFEVGVAPAELRLDWLGEPLSFRPPVGLPGTYSNAQKKLFTASKQIRHENFWYQPVACGRYSVVPAFFPNIHVHCVARRTMMVNYLIGLVLYWRYYHRLDCYCCYHPPSTVEAVVAAVVEDVVGLFPHYLYSRHDCYVHICVKTKGKRNDDNDNFYLSLNELKDLGRRDGERGMLSNK